MINDTKNLLDNNLSIINNNLKIFISEAKRIFKELKIIRNMQINHIYRNNQKINNFNSVSRDKINTNYNIFLNSNSNESFEEKEENNNHNNKILNKHIFNKINNKNNTIENFNKSYFSGFKPKNNDFRSCENIFNEYETNYFSPKQNAGLYNKNYTNYKKVHLNKSQATTTIRAARASTLPRCWPTAPFRAASAFVPTTIKATSTRTAFGTFGRTSSAFTATANG